MDGACLELAGKVLNQTTALPGSDEAVLVRRAQAGDRSAFEALVRLYEAKVLRLVMQLVGSEEHARDLFQEAFLKVYRSMSSFQFKSSFSTWLYRVVANVCFDHLRRQSTREEVQAPAAPEGGTEYFHSIPEERAVLNPEKTLQAREIKHRLDAALTGLSPRERMVFELRHYEGLKLRAIGEICGTTEETAKNCLFRATRKLRVALGDLV
jgi:RNA polymerase sigma-70 factor, ECF subfamily